MKKMVIHGCTGLKNSGDEAILQTILQQYGSDYDITVISKNAEYTRRMHLGVAVISDDKRICREAIRNCDLFLLGGGGLLQDEITMFNVAVWLRYYKYALKQRKKICVYANSIGPVSGKWNRYLIRKYLSNADLITLRDEESARLLDEIGVEGEGKIYVTADPVFSMKWKKRNGGNEESEKYVCMALRHWFDIIPFIPVKICNRFNIRSSKNRTKYNKYIQTMAETALFINEKLGYKVYFISFLYGRDDKVALDILEKMKGQSKKENKLVSGEYLVPEQIVNIIAHSRLLVGMRLHSIIYAICAHVPMVIIDYSLKVRGMVRQNGLDRYCIGIEEIETEKLKKIIYRVLAEEESIKEKLREQKQLMQKREKMNRELIEALMKREPSAPF